MDEATHNEAVTQPRKEKNSAREEPTALERLDRRAHFFRLRPFIWLAICVFVIVVSWVFVEQILLTNVGLDLSDEGLYLIAADPPTTDTVWVFPAGWSTSFLFALAGYDIATFRTLGAVILMALSGILGWLSFGISVNVLLPGRQSFEGQTRNVIQGLIAAGVSLSSLAFYSSMLRTPGYNWVNFTGILLASIGVLLLLQRSRGILQTFDEQGVLRAILSQFWPISVMAFGVFFVSPGKATSAIFIVLAAFVLLWVWFGPRLGSSLVGTVIALTFTFILLAVVVRMWTPNFLQVFWEGVARPPLVPSQSLAGGFREFLALPVEVYVDFRGESWLWVAMSAASFLLLVVSVFIRIHPLLQWPALLVILAAAYIHTQEDWPHWQQIFERGTLTTSILMVFAGVSFTALGLARWGGDVLGTRVAVKIFSASAFLLFMAFAYGFGSSIRPFLSAKFVLVLFVAAAIIITGVLVSLSVRVVLVAVVVVLGLSLTFSLLTESRKLQPGFAPLVNQTDFTTLAPRGSQLYLGEEKAQLARALAQEIREAGGSQVRLLGVGPGTPTLTYISGATLPQTTLVTWFEQEGAEELARYNLALLDSDEWADSWLLVNEEHPETPVITSIIGDHLCRDFPSDYKKVLESRVNTLGLDGDYRDVVYSLWKPEITGRPSVATPCVS
jgi:hypothetical protein